MPNLCLTVYMGLDAIKPVLEGGGVANNTGADQPARPHSLVSAFVICALEGSICLLNIGEI